MHMAPTAFQRLFPRAGLALLQIAVRGARRGNGIGIVSAGRVISEVSGVWTGATADEGGGMNDGWLKTLKAGDRAVCRMSGGKGAAIVTIERITPTGRIRAGGITFRANGVESQRGSWAWRYLVPLTPENANEIRYAELSARFRHMEWENLPLATLEAVEELIDAATAKGSATP